MGSLDVVAAKQQFLSLIDAISASHLPSFAIWLDTKLAEYKVNGFLGADDEAAEKRQYPEWITKSLRLNLSSILDCGPSVETKKAEERAAQYTDHGSDGGSAQHYSNTSGYASHQASDTFAVKVELSSDEDDVESYPAEAQRGAGASGVTSDFMGGMSGQGQHYQASQNVSSSIAGVKRGADSQLVFTPPKQARSVEHKAYSTLPYHPQSPVVTTPAHGSPFTPAQSQQDDVMTPTGETAAPFVSQQPIVVPATLADGVVLPSSSSDPDETPAPPGIGRSSDPPDFTTSPNNLLSFQQLYSAAAKTFPCDFCPKAFPFKSYLDRHLRVHTGARPYKCHYCDKCFSIMGNCVAHQRSLHPEHPVVKPESVLDMSTS